MSVLHDELKAIIDRIEELSLMPNFNGIHSDVFTEAAFVFQENFVVQNQTLIAIYNAVENHIKSSEDSSIRSSIRSSSPSYMYERRTYGVSQDAWEYLRLTPPISTSNNTQGTHLSSKAYDYFIFPNLRNPTNAKTYDFSTFLNDNGLSITQNPNVKIIDTNSNVLLLLSELNSVLDVEVHAMPVVQSTGIAVIKPIHKRANELVRGNTKDKLVKRTITDVEGESSESENDESSQSGTAYGGANGGVYGGYYNHTEVKTFDSSATSVSYSDLSTIRDIAHKDTTPPTVPYAPFYTDATFQYSLELSRRKEDRKYTYTDGSSDQYVTTDVDRILSGANSSGSEDSVLINGVLSLTNKDSKSYPKGLAIKIWIRWGTYIDKYFQSHKYNWGNPSGEDWFIPDVILSRYYHVLLATHEVDITKTNQEIDLHGEYPVVPHKDMTTQLTESDLQIYYFQDTTENQPLYDRVMSHKLTKERATYNASGSVVYSIESDYHKAVYFDNLAALREVYPDTI